MLVVDALPTALSSHRYSVPRTGILSRNAVAGFENVSSIDGRVVKLVNLKYGASTLEFGWIGV